MKIQEIMGLNSVKEPRTECEGGLIFFDELGFGIDDKVFKKIADDEVLMYWCIKCHNDITKCIKHDLFLNILNEASKNG